MAGGFAKDGAVQEQIDASISDAISHARSRLPKGTSRSQCAECEDPIPAARRAAIPGVQLCIACQSRRDAQTRLSTGYNRRGSKDSQLK